MTAEFPRPVPVDRLPAAITVTANPAELVALAARLNVPAVLALQCRYALRRQGDAVLATGALAARLVQSCVVTLDDVEQDVAEAFTVRFVPAGTETEDDDPDAVDELPYAGPAIDLGEAAAEQLALAMDPYPRSPGAVLDAGAGDDAGPLAGLRSLGRKPD